jgi:2-polyprenyl-3-methyl-5-hydroxy-6-metoxy-1,4-benzoquinol methylase
LVHEFASTTRSNVDDAGIEMKSNSNRYIDDPVAAYTLLAPYYAAISSRRQCYLRSIENAVVSRIPAGSKSLLDIGAGDGSRALEIARRCGIANIVLVEPSLGMAARAAGIVKMWNVRAEEFSDCSSQFEVITCLWNVLGHICGVESRARAMKIMGRLLTPGGRCFVDVTHRYNLRSYGIFSTVARFIRDSICYKNESADVTATWRFGDKTISTYGHVFTDHEIRQLAHAAGLEIEHRIAVDYDSGKIRRFAFTGNLLYVLRRKSMIDSASAPHTS